MEPRNFDGVKALFLTLAPLRPQVTHPYRVVVRYFPWQNKKADSFCCHKSGEAVEIMAQLYKQKEDMAYTWESVELLHVTLPDSSVCLLGTTLLKWTNTITIATSETAQG